MAICPRLRNGPVTRGRARPAAPGAFAPGYIGISPLRRAGMAPLRSGVAPYTS